MPRKKLTPLEIEESERELVFKNEQWTNSIKSHWFKEQIKAKVSRKTFKLGSRHSGDRKELTFEKAIHDRDSALRITSVHLPTRIEKCSLGHEHEVKSKQEKWEFFTLPWSQVESFIGWLQTGDYREVRGKVTKEEKLLIEAYKFCEMAKSDPMLKPHAQKLKTKIGKYMNLDKHHQETEQLPIFKGQVDLRDENPLDFI